MRAPFACLLVAACLAAGGLSPHGAAAQPVARFLGHHVWVADLAGFGEFSGLHMRDGRGFVSVTDTGRLARGVLDRDSDGRIVAVRLLSFERLRGPDGAVLRGLRADAEAVARAPDGRLFIAFEQDHSILTWPPGAEVPVPLPVPKAFARLRPNLGIEALALDATGTLLAIPELPPEAESEADSGPGHPVYRLRAGVWDADLSLSRDPFYLPVGADFGPDGGLYLLERSYLPIVGYRSRVRRFDMVDGVPGAGRVILETARGDHGNLEGLAVWADPQGAIVLTMISDTNRNLEMPVEWVEYRLPR